jgi:hypothetical protein
LTTIAIELIDTGVAAFDESGLVLPPDPGYALVEGEELVTGHAALGRGRLKPRRVHHRFWDELDTAPLPRPFPRGLNRGDLAHAHLSRLWSTLLQRPTSAPSKRPASVPADPASVPADAANEVLLAVPALRHARSRNGRRRRSGLGTRLARRQTPPSRSPAPPRDTHRDDPGGR